MEMFQSVLFEWGTKTIQTLVFLLLSLQSRFKKRGFIFVYLACLCIFLSKVGCNPAITLLGDPHCIPEEFPILFIQSKTIAKSQTREYCENFFRHYDTVTYYIGENPRLRQFSLSVFTVICWHLLFRLYTASLVYSCSLASGTMVARRPTDQIDSAPFVVGMITVLKQFHSEYTEQFLACCGQYARSLIEASATK